MMMISFAHCGISLYVSENFMRIRTANVDVFLTRDVSIFWGQALRRQQKQVF
jgi:hypothetical protein